MNTLNLLQTGISAGILAGATWLMTGGEDMEVMLQLAAIQAGCSLASDLAHKALSVKPSVVSDSLLTGGLYSAVHYFVLHNTDHYLEHFAMSGGCQFAAATSTSIFETAEPDSE